MEEIKPLLLAIRNAGGRALLVGGAVRDMLLGRSSKDVDLEVHSLPLTNLLQVIGKFGHVDEVGKDFGVLKMRFRGLDLDISIPRSDRQTGSGHRSIEATADPFLGTTEAARRRDLTINAIAWDPLTGEFVDPFGGREDIQNGILRVVNPSTFGEDPLRALRAARFIGRFGFSPTQELEDICRAMNLTSLPAERILTEVVGILRSPMPARAWNFAWKTGLWKQVLPPWDTACPTKLVRVDTNGLSHEDALVLLFAGACSELNQEQTEDVFDRLKLFKWEGCSVRGPVLALIQHLHLDLTEDTAIRRAAVTTSMRLLARLREEVLLMERAHNLGVGVGPLPSLIQGKDLIQMGITPGPRMGEILARIRNLQLDGQIQTRAEALAEVLRT